MYLGAKVRASREQRRATRTKRIDEARSPAASLALITLWRSRHLSPENNRRVGRARARAARKKREEGERRSEGGRGKEESETTDTDVVMGLSRARGE